MCDQCCGQPSSRSGSYKASGVTKSEVMRMVIEVRWEHLPRFGKSVHAQVTRENKLVTTQSCETNFKGQWQETCWNHVCFPQC